MPVSLSDMRELWSEAFVRGGDRSRRELQSSFHDSNADPHSSARPHTTELTKTLPLTSGAADQARGCVPAVNLAVSSGRSPSPGWTPWLGLEAVIATATHHAFQTGAVVIPT